MVTTRTRAENVDLWMNTQRKIRENEDRWRDALFVAIMLIQTDSLYI